MIDWLIRLDPLNPQTTARLAAAFGTWRMFDAGRQALIRAELERLAALPGPLARYRRDRRPFAARGNRLMRAARLSCPRVKLSR